MTEDADITIEVFKCLSCNSKRPHALYAKYVYNDDEVWLVVCENCEKGRVIYANERITVEQSFIIRCKCGKWKLKGQKCLECIILEMRG